MLAKLLECTVSTRLADSVLGQGASWTDIPSGYRHLHPEEIVALELAMNSSPSWNGVLLAEDFKGLHRVRGCYFDGRIMIDGFIDDVSIGHDHSLPSGLFNSNFSGFCFCGNSCLIRNTTSVRNIVVNKYCCISDCGVITCDGYSTFANGVEILLGPESNGGRKLPMFFGASYGDICRVALDRTDFTFRKEYSEKCRIVVSSTHSSVSILGEHVNLSRNDVVKNVILGPHCKIHASTVENCTIGSSEEHPILISGNSSLDTCILSGANKITGPCSMLNTLLLEQASVSVGAHISNCVLGPDSSLSRAECFHSLIGPFIGIHHSSLIVSCSWPTGRGNIAYGAKVGANHTGRLNDQECLSGEGCFYGLGVQLKYPFNTLCAPYSLFAGINILF